MADRRIADRLRTAIAGQERRCSSWRPASSLDQAVPLRGVLELCRVSWHNRI